MKFIVDTDDRYNLHQDDDGEIYWVFYPLKNNGTVVPIQQIDEDAVKKLDVYIKGVYSHHRWECNDAKRFDGSGDDYEGDVDGARKEVGKIKPIAKAFCLYPYNQKVIRSSWF